MGEYEPHDSRNVTLKDERAPGEPPRTGPRERQARRRCGKTPAAAVIAAPSANMPQATSGIEANKSGKPPMGRH